MAQKCRNRVVEIANAQLGFESLGGELTGELFQFLTAHRYQRVGVEAGADDSVWSILASGRELVSAPPV
jgi:hypothetical protein